MKKLLILSMLLAAPISAFAGVVGGGLDTSKFSKDDLDLASVYYRDMVHQYIKDRTDCGQQEDVQIFEYEKFSRPGCVNLGVNLLTVFTFEEPIKSYVTSDPEETGFFNVGVWISSDDARDANFINQKSFYVKAKYPRKSANIVFLAKSGRQYHFDLKSLGLDDSEVPTRSVYNKLPEKLFNEVREVEEEKKEEKLEHLIEAAKRINFEQDNAFSKYMANIHGREINTNYELRSINEGNAIKPFAVYDNGKRTFFNFDGILSSEEDRPSIKKVHNGVDIPLFPKEAYTLSPDYRGWIYVESISQEGFTLTQGEGKDEKVLCIKPTVDLRKFHNQKKKKDGEIISFETPRETIVDIEDKKTVKIEKTTTVDESVIVDGEMKVDDDAK
tara:strand:- start:13742 stop:14899 length:1158 start_codon:yes stop_codon:yes gene_type:complete